MFPYSNIGMRITTNFTQNGLPLKQPLDVNDFFDSLYAIMYPVMPFLMIAGAAIMAGYLIVVIRKSFSFENLTGSKEDYGYKDKDND